MIVEMANGKLVISNHIVGTIDFDLEKNPTFALFRIIPIGIYDGNLGLDWLVANKANISCAKGKVISYDKYGGKALVQGKRGILKMELVKLVI